MTAVFTLIFGLMGLAVGSFLNVCIDRLPGKKSLAFPPSHCESCQHPLAARDLVPVFSYLWLRGRCRYCGARIPLRIPLVEAATGTTFAVLFWRFGFSWEFPLYTFYICVLLVLSMIDLDHQLILNVIVYPAAAIALVISFFLPGFDIYKGALGGATGFAALMLVALLFRNSMGWGDVKMAGLIGLMTGFPGVLVALLGGTVLGGVIATVLLVARHKSRKDAIPFGPFLALGALLGLFWGGPLVEWYLSFFR